MQTDSKKSPKRVGRMSGFSLIELVVVILIALIVGAMAIPGYQSATRYLRISGDGRDLNGVIAGSKMQAAADFTHARVYVDLVANTFHAETWRKAVGAVAGCWQTVGDSDAAGNPRCTIPGTSPVQ